MALIRQRRGKGISLARTVTSVVVPWPIFVAKAQKHPTGLYCFNGVHGEVEGNKADPSRVLVETEAAQRQLMA